MHTQRFDASLFHSGQHMLISINSTENKTRIIKMISLDGEYMLLGRKSQDVTNIFVQYGQGATRTVNITGGNATQEAEFVDGLRFSIRSAEPFTLNADIPFGVDEAAVPTDAVPLSIKTQTHSLL
jgi:hypothetical protein